mgnify:CR=1 FL=1
MPGEVNAVLISVDVPERVMVAEASITTVVFSSSVLRAAASTEASSMVME